MLIRNETERITLSLLLNISMAIILIVLLTYITAGLYLIGLYGMGSDETSCVVQRQDSTIVYCQSGKNDCMTKRDPNVDYVGGKIIHGNIRCYNSVYLRYGILVTLCGLGFMIGWLIIRYGYHPMMEADRCLLDEV